MGLVLRCKKSHPVYNIMYSMRVWGERVSTRICTLQRHHTHPSSVCNMQWFVCVCVFFASKEKAHFPMHLVKMLSFFEKKLGCLSRRKSERLVLVLTMHWYIISTDFYKISVVFMEQISACRTRTMSVHANLMTERLDEYWNCPRWVCVVEADVRQSESVAPSFRHMYMYTRTI